MRKYLFLGLVLMTLSLNSAGQENGWKGASVDFKHGKLKVS